MPDSVPDVSVGASGDPLGDPVGDPLGGSVVGMYSDPLGDPLGDADDVPVGPVGSAGDCVGFCSKVVVGTVRVGPGPAGGAPRPGSTCTARASA
ncbi:hypothetical protein AB4212_57955, partial [Streptomyces sp. 2MCAF27]